mgnify:FL=1
MITSLCWQKIVAGKSVVSLAALCGVFHIAAIFLII